MQIKGKFSGAGGLFRPWNGVFRTLNARKPYIGTFQACLWTVRRQSRLELKKFAHLYTDSIRG